MRVSPDIRPHLGYAVNGLYLTKNDLGITRYAREIVREMDNLVSPGEIVVVVPEDTEDPGYKNIDVVEYGNRSGILWEQLDFAHYLVKTGLRSLNLTNTLPLLAPKGITVLHDISYIVNPAFFPGARGLLSRLWHVANYRCAVRHSDPLVTVSNFSKEEIVRVYGVDPDRVAVIPNAWQHMQRIKADDSIIDRLDLRKKPYYYTLSSMAPNKNVGWIVESAWKTPDATFVIAGGSRIQESLGDNLPANVVLPGFVTDDESKALMDSCEAFLFPTFYEGFGIPPLEAFACGAAVIVSDTPCMREVMGGVATYVNPMVPTDISTLSLVSEGTASPLDAYSWRRSAESLLQILSNSHPKNSMLID